MQRSRHCGIAFCETPERLGLRRPRFASAKGDVRTATGQVNICVLMLAYGRNPAYPISRGQDGQISRMQGGVVRSSLRSKLSAGHIYIRTCARSAYGIVPHRPYSQGCCASTPRPLNIFPAPHPRITPRPVPLSRSSWGLRTGIL